MRKVVLIVIMLIAVGAHSQVNVFLIGRTIGEKIIANGDTIRVYGFAPNLGSHPPIPAPLIEANQGDSVIIDFWNVSQLHKHTIHLHGLDVDQQNDGVPMLSFDVGHMEHGWYRFKAPHAGTYLYHCHVGSTLHLQAGMYGPIIIRPSDGSNTTWDGGYAFDTETMLFMSEIDTFWHTDSILDHEHDTLATHDSLDIPIYNPDFFLINGFSDQQLEDTVEVDTKTDFVNYLRLVNIGYCTNRVIFPAGFNAQLIDSDGRPLPTPLNQDTVYVYPGERYGVLGESNMALLDSIQVDYLDMMTGTLKNTQYVKLNIQVPNEIKEHETDIELQLMPNPVQENLIAQVQSNGGEATIRITSIAGSLVKSEVVQLVAGTSVLELNLANLEAGSYVLSIVLGNMLKSAIFLKK